MNELYHHGIEGQKWGVRNGPPYPLRESVSSKVGKKRAQRRIDYVESNTKSRSASVSLSKQLSTLKMEDLRKQAEDILNNEERAESFGRRTIANRAAAFSVGHTAAVGLAYIMATAAAAPVSVALGSAAIPVGASWLYYHYSKR